VYLPATFGSLTQLRDQGALAATEGFAVTPQLRALLGEDDEQLAYAAFQLAAEASLRLLAADPAARRRRVVVAADVPAEVAGEGGLVWLAGPVPLAAVAAVHVDGPDAEPDLVAGDPAAHELEWYAVSELAQLLSPA
jgi:hypothetical protein